MTLPNGPPTPIGVGGPTPPPVSGERGRVEDENTHRRAPYLAGGRGSNISRSTGERGASTDSGRRGRASPDSGRERRIFPHPGREEEGQGKGGGEPTEPIKTTDTTVPHEPGTSYVRSKREPSPKKGQTVH